jgi:hypothetical protein
MRQLRIGARRQGVGALINNATGPTAHDPAARNGDGVPLSVTTFLRSLDTVPPPKFFSRFFGRPPVPPSLRSQYREALGDVAVIDTLLQLGSDWLVRTCEVSGGNGVEHVVVGPPGIFCIAVRYRRGGAVWIDGSILLVDGERWSDLRDAEFNAVRLTQVMSDAVGFRVEATPCLVLVGTRSLTVAKPPRRVAVLTTRDIRTWLKGMPATLSTDEAKALRMSAAAYPGWHLLGGPQAPSASALGVFRKVRAAMGHARHVRLTWVTGVLVLLWLMVVVCVGGMTTGLLAT